jgi:hypothetical protein
MVVEVHTVAPRHEDVWASGVQLHVSLTLVSGQIHAPAILSSVPIG